MQINSLDDIIDSGKYKGKKVKDVLRSSKRNIFKLLKDGFVISDEILAKYGIKKEIRDVKVSCDTIFDKNEIKKTEVNKVLSEKDVIDDNFFVNDDETINIDENFHLMGTLIYEADIEKE